MPPSLWLRGGGQDAPTPSDGSFEIAMNKGKVDVRSDALNQMEGRARKALNQIENIAAGGGAEGATAKAFGAASTKPTESASTEIGQRQHISSKFPISRSELPHFALMSIMMFLFIYVFTTVRDTKDTLVVSNCGAEAIPFLKLYGVMPCATAFIIGYSKLSNALGKRALFYTTLVPFFVFYLGFAWVLFPMRDKIHFPAATAAAAVADRKSVV